jgi:hypothetical protein
MLAFAGRADQPVLIQCSFLCRRIGSAGRAKSAFRNGTRGARQGEASFCITCVVDNRFGWRLPTIQELTSLLDLTAPVPGPALTHGHPFDAPESAWSANTTIDSDTSAFLVEIFQFASPAVADKTNNGIAAWCVRGGIGSGMPSTQ